MRWNHLTSLSSDENVLSIDAPSARRRSNGRRTTLSPLRRRRCTSYNFEQYLQVELGASAWRIPSLSGPNTAGQRKMAENRHDYCTVPDQATVSYIQCPVIREPGPRRMSFSHHTYHTLLTARNRCCIGNRLPTGRLRLPGRGDESFRLCHWLRWACQLRMTTHDKSNFSPAPRKLRKKPKVYQQAVGLLQSVWSIGIEVVTHTLLNANEIKLKASKASKASKSFPSITK